MGIDEPNDGLVSDVDGFNTWMESLPGGPEDEQAEIRMWLAWQAGRRHATVKFEGERLELDLLRRQVIELVNSVKTWGEECVRLTALLNEAKQQAGEALP